MLGIRERAERLAANATVSEHVEDQAPPVGEAPEIVITPVG
jgi:hypothetical protein